MAVVVQTYSVSAKTEAHRALANLINSGPAAGSVRFRDAAGVLVATVPLMMPCGSVNVTTGRLTFAMAGRDEFVDISAVISWADVADSLGNIYLQLPAVAGVAAVDGKIVVNNLTVAAGGTLEVVSLIVG